jgi:hypothetical protein
VDKVFYFLLVLLVVAYFLIPKIAGFEYTQVFWQYEWEKYQFLLNDFRSHGITPVFGSKIPLSPQGAAAFYQNAILNQLQVLENIEFK